MNGLPVKYERKLSDGTTYIYLLDNVNYDIVSSSKFEIPKSGYRVMNYEEVKKIESLLFNQLPLPKDARISPETSLILGEGDNWAGRIELFSNMGGLEASTYFTTEYPKLGWNLVSSAKSKFTILVFASNTRTVTIEISEGGTFSAKSKIVMTVSPKVINEAPIRRQ